MNAMKFPGGSFDFHYPAARSMAAGINPYSEEATAFHNELGLDKYYFASWGAKYANTPPPAIMFMLPFSLLEPWTANLVWCICNVIASLGIVLLLKYLFLDKLYHGENKAFICLIFASVFLAGTPTRNVIGLGQNSVISFFFFLLSLRLSEKGYRNLAGIALSASVFKYTLTIPMSLYYIYKRKYREIVIAGSINILLTLAASIRIGVSPFKLIDMSLRVASYFANIGFYDICHLLNTHNIAVPAVLLVMMIAFVCYCSVKAPDNDYEMMSMLTVFTLVFVYHIVYDYFVLIIPLIIITLYGEYKLYEKVLVCLSVAYIFFVQRIAVSFANENVYAILYYIFAVVFYLMFFSLFYRFAKNIYAGS